MEQHEYDRAFEYWDNRRVECEHGLNIAYRRIGSLALANQLVLDLGEPVAPVIPIQYAKKTPNAGK